MSVTMANRIRAEKATREDFKKRYEEDIAFGKSMERLSVNHDWLKLKALIDDKIKFLEGTKVQLYDSIVSNKVTEQSKVEAIGAIQLASQELADFKFIVGLPDLFISSGQEARELLDKLNKEEE